MSARRICGMHMQDACASRSCETEMHVRTDELTHADTSKTDNRSGVSNAREHEPFHRFVDSSGGAEACWPWTGSVNPWGYGRARILVDGRTVEVTASRAAYIAANGPIPSSVHVLHSCDNRPCCNPRHLRAGTHLENMADRKARGNYKRGAECPVALQLAPELVAQIRAAHRPGVPGHGTPSLARRFGVSRTTVQRIVTGSDRWSTNPAAEEAP